jgi:hypothetical protein
LLGVPVDPYLPACLLTLKRGWVDGWLIVVEINKEEVMMEKGYEQHEKIKLGLFPEVEVTPGLVSRNRLWWFLLHARCMLHYSYSAKGKPGGLSNDVGMDAQKKGRAFVGG